MGIRSPPSHLLNVSSRLCVCSGDSVVFFSLKPSRRILIYNSQAFCWDVPVEIHLVLRSLGVRVLVGRHLMVGSEHGGQDSPGAWRESCVQPCSDPRLRVKGRFHFLSSRPFMAQRPRPPPGDAVQTMSTGIWKTRWDGCTWRPPLLGRVSTW